ncbi:MAG: DUF5615 family PIN-like protein [Gemmatales bacterium]
MSQPKFLADEDWRFEIVLAVRRYKPAIEISTIVELGRSGLPDAEQLAFAHENNWLLLSHDVNPLKGEAELRIKDCRGIAGLFLASQRSLTRAIAESLVMIWAASAAEEWKDRIVYLPI